MCNTQVPRWQQPALPAENAQIGTQRIFSRKICGDKNFYAAPTMPSLKDDKKLRSESSSAEESYDSDSSATTSSGSVIDDSSYDSESTTDSECSSYSDDSEDTTGSDSE